MTIITFLYKGHYRCTYSAVDQLLSHVLKRVPVDHYSWIVDNAQTTHWVEWDGKNLSIRNQLNRQLLTRYDPFTDEQINNIRIFMMAHTEPPTKPQPTVSGQEFYLDTDTSAHKLSRALLYDTNIEPWISTGAIWLFKQLQETYRRLDVDTSKLTADELAEIDDLLDTLSINQHSRYIFTIVTLAVNPSAVFAIQV
jgi:hypothetical protein